MDTNRSNDGIDKKQRYLSTGIVIRLAAVIVLNTATPIAMKMSAMMGDTFMDMVNIWTVAAGLSTVVSFFFWRDLLNKNNLSRLHPFLALVQLTVPIAAWLFFREQINSFFFLGLAFIIVGLLMTSGATTPNDIGADK